MGVPDRSPLPPPPAPNRGRCLNSVLHSRMTAAAGIPTTEAEGTSLGWQPRNYEERKKPRKRQ